MNFGPGTHLFFPLLFSTHLLPFIPFHFFQFFSFLFEPPKRPSLLPSTEKAPPSPRRALPIAPRNHITYTFYVYVLRHPRKAPPLPLSPFGGKSPRRRRERVPPFGRVPLIRHPLRFAPLRSTVWVYLGPVWARLSPG